MRLDRATWPEVRDADPDVALLPTGSTEQHGPHGPLGTDAVIATAIADDVAEATGALRLPAVRVGLSPEHRGFDGTLSLSPDTFRAVVRETAASAASHGVGAVVAVNGHGGNVPALEEVCAGLTRDDVVFATAWTWWDAVDAGAGDAPGGSNDGEDGTDAVDGDDGPALGHAGPLETAMLLHLAPELVGDDRRAGADGWGEWIESAQVSYDADDFTQDGVVGDPGDADAATGERLFDEATASLERLVGWLREHRC